MRKNHALSPAEKSDARKALCILDGSGLSLEEAARRAIDGKLAASKVTVQEGRDAFMESLKTQRPTTIMWYEDKLRALDFFSGEQVDAVTRAKFRTHLAAFNVSESTIFSYTRAARTLWRWMIAQEPPMAGQDITAGLRVTPRRKSKSTKFLTPEQARLVMKSALPSHRAAIALMLFAGIRPEEISGRGKPPMLWRNVNLADRLVTVPPECSKVVGSTRTLEGLPPALWAFIGNGEPDAPICPTQGYRAAQKAKRCLGMTQADGHDILRHTFATYATAHTESPGKVSLWLGHEGDTSMLFSHYKGAGATKAQAEAFFSLKP